MPKGSGQLQKELLRILSPSLFLTEQEYDEFLLLVKSGNITKDENPEHHCNVFFIPFNPKTKEIVIVHHKKAKQWIVPGGHIEKGESLTDAVRREAREELGIYIKRMGNPFSFSVMYVHNEGQPCRAHYDVWHLIPLTEELHIDFTEFNHVQWANKQQAKKLITHRTYLQALERIAAF